MLRLQFMLMKLLVVRSKRTLFSSEVIRIPFDRAQCNMKLKPAATAEYIQ